MPDPFTIRLPAPASGKNRQRIVAWGSRCPVCKRPAQSSIRKSREAEQDEKHIRAAVEATARFPSAPLFGDDDVAVLITFHARTADVDLEVRSIRPRPAGFSGRQRDLHNLVDVLMDAIQGIVFENDNQVARIALVRKLD